jgi:hypothetical protein
MRQKDAQNINQPLGFTGLLIACCAAQRDAHASTLTKHYLYDKRPKSILAKRQKVELTARTTSSFGASIQCQKRK